MNTQEKQDTKFLIIGLSICAVLYFACGLAFDWIAFGEHSYLSN